MTQQNLKSGKTRPIQCRSAHSAHPAVAPPGVYPAVAPPVPAAPSAPPMPA